MRRCCACSSRPAHALPAKATRSRRSPRVPVRSPSSADADRAGVGYVDADRAGIEPGDADHGRGGPRRAAAERAIVECADAACAGIRRHRAAGYVGATRADVGCTAAARPNRDRRTAHTAHATDYADAHRAGVRHADAEFAHAHDPAIRRRAAVVPATEFTVTRRATSRRANPAIARARRPGAESAHRRRRDGPQRRVRPRDERRRGQGARRSEGPPRCVLRRRHRATRRTVDSPAGSRRTRQVTFDDEFGPLRRARQRAARGRRPRQADAGHTRVHAGPHGARGRSGRRPCGTRRHEAGRRDVRDDSVECGDLYRRAGGRRRRLPVPERAGQGERRLRACAAAGDRVADGSRDPRLPVRRPHAADRAARRAVLVVRRPGACARSETGARRHGEVAAAGQAGDQRRSRRKRLSALLPGCARST